MVARDAKRLAGREASERRLAAGELIARPAEGRFEQFPVMHAGLTPVFGQLLVVNGELAQRRPALLHELASASLGRTTPRELPMAVSFSSSMGACLYGCDCAPSPRRMAVSVDRGLSRRVLSRTGTCGSMPVSSTSHANIGAPPQAIECRFGGLIAVIEKRGPTGNGRLYDFKCTPIPW